MFWCVHKLKSIPQCFRLCWWKHFIERSWDFYGGLCEFRENPDSEIAKQLSTKFDQVFSTITGYEKLDERICKTKENKEHLLKVLILPEIPLHNNAAELAARAKVRKRDVSLQTKTDEGTRANDTFMTIVQTAKKLSVSAYDYIFPTFGSKHIPTSIYP
ncbi:MAG: transposase [Methanosarcina barkeri]|nr:transposase [Methanosarcina sp. ERenArc_MAG2]